MQRCAPVRHLANSTVTGASPSMLHSPFQPAASKHGNEKHRDPTLSTRLASSSFTACRTHSSEQRHWVGTTVKCRRLRCRRCSSTATRAWRTANPWRRVWQSLVQRARRKFAIPVDAELSWRNVGEATVLACANHAFATDAKSIEELDAAVSRFSGVRDRSRWVVTWRPGCTRWNPDQLRLVPLARSHVHADKGN